MSPRINSIYIYLAVALTFAIAIGWNVQSPGYSDDWIYRYAASGDIEENVFWQLQGERLTSWSQVPGAVISHWQTVNGRLGNLVFTAFQVLPRWASLVGDGLMCGLLLVMLLNLGGARWRERPWLVTAAVFMLWTVPLWSDQMQSACFQFNYTWGCALMAAALHAIRPGHRMRWWDWATVLVFGLWHETTTGLTVTFLSVRWLYDRRDRRLAAVLVLLTLCTVCQLSPGTVGRAHSLNTTLSFGDYPKLPLVTSKWLVAVALLLWIWRRRRVTAPARRSLDCMGWGMTAALTVGLAVVMVLSAPPRSLWAVDIIAIAFVLRLLATFKPHGIPWWCAAGLLALYTCWGCSLVKWEALNKGRCAFVAERLQGDTNIIFTDQPLLDNRDIPWWLMGMVHSPYDMSNAWATECEAQGVSDRRFKCYMILPRSLQGKPFGQWPAVPGNTGMRGVGQTFVSRDSIAPGTRYFLTVGEPTIAMSPLNRAMAACSRGLDRASLSLKCTRSLPVTFQGDTLWLNFFETQPRTVYGRRLLSLDK